MPGPRTGELNGLNWHVQVEPLTLSMTSLPPTVVPPPLVVVFDEDPPQAATSRHAVANMVSHLKRFIDTLRSRSRFERPSPTRSSVRRPILNRHYLGNA